MLPVSWKKEKESWLEDELYSRIKVQPVEQDEVQSLERQLDRLIWLHCKNIGTDSYGMLPVSWKKEKESWLEDELYSRELQNTLVTRTKESNMYATAGTRLALQYILRDGSKVYSFRLQGPMESLGFFYFISSICIYLFFSNYSV